MSTRILDAVRDHYKRSMMDHSVMIIIDVNITDYGEHHTEWPVLLPASSSVKLGLCFERPYRVLRNGVAERKASYALALRGWELLGYLNSRMDLRQNSIP